MSIDKLPTELRKRLKHNNGVDCRCHAWSDSECGCGANWQTDDEVVMNWLREHPDNRHDILDIFLEGEQ